MKILKAYGFSILMALIMVGLYAAQPQTGAKALDITLSNTWEMLTFLPPIFILVGLLDVWVPKETMIKYMGHGSGIKGVLIAFILGSAAAGPLYAAFPIAAVLLRKGARFAYVLFFLGAWSSTKLPLVLYETASLGVKFTSIHMTLGITGFLTTAYIIEKLVSQDSIHEIYNKAQQET